MQNIDTNNVLILHYFCKILEGGTFTLAFLSSVNCYLRLLATADDVKIYKCHLIYGLSLEFAGN